MDVISTSTSASTWLADLCGEPEPELQQNISYDSDTGELITPKATFNAGTFTTHALSDLLSDAKLKLRLLGLKKNGQNYPQVTVVQGVDVGAAILAAKQGAIFQVASQFNCLEMLHPGVSPSDGITNYTLDPTQGPRAVLACAPGLIVRNHYYPETNLLEDMRLECQNGYLLWGKHPEDILTHLDVNKVKIGVMANTTVAGVTLKEGQWIQHQQDKTITQIFTAAAPVNCYANSGDITTQLKIAKLLIKTQYLAILAYAIRDITSQLYKVPPIHLTLLGAGAFGVPLAVVVEALTEALRYFSHPLPVVLHCYHKSESVAVRGLEWPRWKVVLAEEPEMEYPLRPHQLTILNELLKLSSNLSVGEPSSISSVKYYNSIEDIEATLYATAEKIWYVNVEGLVRTLLYH